MKTFSFILLTLICFTSQNSFSQEEAVVKDSAYVADYEKLKTLHLKQLNSEIHIESSKLMMSFMKKMNRKDKTPITKPDDIINWVKDNMEQTDFLSFTQAEFEWGIINKLQMESIQKNQEYYDFMIVAMRKHGVEIITDESMNTMNEYPEKFGLPAELKGKLKQD